MHVPRKKLCIAHTLSLSPSDNKINKRFLDAGTSTEQTILTASASGKD